MSWWYRPYVSVAQRRAKAERKVASLAKKGHAISPVKIDGRKIATTFWGKAWCDHLEAFSDYESRLPRGRTYVRNGSVVDLQIGEGKITAMVSGSELYDVSINIHPLKSDRWSAVKTRCGGQIASVIELLQGRLSSAVMEIITCPNAGLFPQSNEIRLSCSCPDSARLCKHVAAVLYGVGARLDQQPDLLFKLRKVDHFELIQQAGNVNVIANTGSAGATIADDALADVFGIELDTATAPLAAHTPLSAPAEAPAASSPSVFPRLTPEVAFTVDLPTRKRAAKSVAKPPTGKLANGTRTTKANDPSRASTKRSRRVTPVSPDSVKGSKGRRKAKI